MTCANGYSGMPSPVTCSTSATWTAATGCTQDCSDPAQTGYAFAAGGVSQGTTRASTCDAGYSGSASPITCGASSTWSLATGCTAGCAAPAQTGYDFQDGPVQNGATRAASCAVGYSLAESASTITITCTAAVWSNAVGCTQDCPPTTPPQAGYVFAAGVSNAQGSVRSVACDSSTHKGVATAVMCGHTATWGLSVGCIPKSSSYSVPVSVTLTNSDASAWVGSDAQKSMVAASIAKAAGVSVDRVHILGDAPQTTLRVEIMGFDDAATAGFVASTVHGAPLTGLTGGFWGSMTASDPFVPFAAPFALTGQNQSGLTDLPVTVVLITLPAGTGWIASSVQLDLLTAAIATTCGVSTASVMLLGDIVESTTGTPQLSAKITGFASSASQTAMKIKIDTLPGAQLSGLSEGYVGTISTSVLTQTSSTSANYPFSGSTTAGYSVPFTVGLVSGTWMGSDAQKAALITALAKALGIPASSIQLTGASDSTGAVSGQIVGLTSKEVAAAVAAALSSLDPAAWFPGFYATLVATAPTAAYDSVFVPTTAAPTAAKPTVTNSPAAGAIPDWENQAHATVPMYASLAAVALVAWLVGGAL